MSKSLGNFITIDDFLKKYSADVMRWIVLSHHYRSPLSFSWALAEEATTAFKTVEDFVAKAGFVSNVKGNKNLPKSDLTIDLKEFDNKFYAALNDDFNTPLALGHLFGLITKIQPKIWQINTVETKMLANHIIETFKILGLKIKIPKIPRAVAILAQKRELLRVNKQFIQSDDLRKKIRVLGYETEDTPLGPWIKQK